MVFQCIYIRQVPREVLKTAASGLGFQSLPRDLANVNAWKAMFDPYNATISTLQKWCESFLCFRYIVNPLLLAGKKFDVRCYMLIASTAPYLVLFRHGFVRVSCNNYDQDDLSLTTHLTNQVKEV